MFGFLFKIVIVVALVAGVGGYLVVKRGGSVADIPSYVASLPNTFSLKNAPKLISNLNLKTIDTSNLGGKLSEALDALVTHPDKNSPVVLGVKVTNDSISTITDVIMKLPNEQLNQIRNVVCVPVK